MQIGKRFEWSSPNGSIGHSFLSTGQLGRHYHVLLERHLGPCECSFCRKGDPGYKRPLDFKLDGIGWNMINWPTPWSRWYLRWAKVRHAK